VGLAVGVAVKAGSHGRGGPLYQALAVFLTYTAICGTYVPYIVDGLRQSAANEGKKPDAGPTTNKAPEGVVPPEAAPPGVSGSAVAGPAAEDRVSDEPTSAGQVAIALILIPILVMAFAYAAPFLGGFENILGLAIIAFGLYEAWKINRREAHAISGPFAVGAPRAVAPASAGPSALG
jgi:hypothetical protein